MDRRFNRKMVAEDLEHCLKLRESGMQWKDIAEKYGETVAAIQCRVRRYGNSKQPLKQQVLTEQATRQIEDLNDPRIQSLLAKAEVNLEEWRPTRAVVNEWGANSNYQAKVWLEYTQAGKVVRELAKDLIADIGAISKEVNEIQAMYEPPGNGEYAVELSCAEPHIGKLGWAPEVGEDYDSRIAIERAKAAIKDNIQRSIIAYPPAEFVYVVGNDFMHIDSKVSTTTAGTYQDTDTRWHKIFRSSHELAQWTIQLLRSFSVPVHVYVVSGNHDELSMFALGEVLMAAFRGDEFVQVYNEPALRKYYRFGYNQIGFTHGEDIKMKDLPLVMADEDSRNWGECRFHAWHIGHWHKLKELSYLSKESFRSIEVHVLPSLCGLDAWHYRKGYYHVARSEAHVWDRERGRVATFIYTPEAVCEMK